jgi:hypothetical protein
MLGRVNGSGGDVRAGALERGGTRPRGRSALERGGPHLMGRSALERGGPRPRGIQPSSEADLTRGGVQVGRGGHQGCDCFSVCISRLVD